MYDPARQNKLGQFGAPFLDGWSYEEWLGITSQGSGKNSPFERQLRKAYFEYKKAWDKYK
jgi:beta-glucuronidase